jgi:uncharacterized membrane protein
VRQARKDRLVYLIFAEGGPIEVVADYVRLGAVRFRQNIELTSTNARETVVPHARGSPERLSMFSDGVFAVLITVLVLELRPPEPPTFRALFLLWPTWPSYAVSYFFIAIVWINHHHLLSYATEATPRLMWFNFAHLFSVSLLPLSTAWMAVSKLAPQPVAFYAAVFFFVNATYMALIWELLERSPVKELSPKKRRVMRFRSIATLTVFGLAAVAAFKYPLVGLGMCIFCLVIYLKPEDIVP